MNEKGIGVVLVLMLTAILLILAATAFKIGYSLHKQNLDAKTQLQKNANAMTAK